MSDATTSGASRPDPENNLIAALRWIMDGIDEIRHEREERRISATEAAKTLGYSESYLRGHAWRIPDFGRTGTMHSLVIWKAWMAKPETERRATWDNMPIKERRKILGLSEKSVQEEGGHR